MHTYSIKGSKFYRECLQELLQLPQSIDAFKQLVKMNLRSFLRREQSNRQSKIECTIKIIQMYLHHVDKSNAFYESCVREIATEFEG